MPTDALSLSTALPPLLVNEREARRLLGGLCAKTMYNLRRTGELPGVKIGSRIMYDVADLRRLIDRKKGMDRSTASNRVIPRWPNPRRRANAEALEAQLEWHGGKVLFTAAAYARLCNALRISSSSIDLAADDLVALGRAEFRETGAGWMLVLNFRRTNP